MLLTPSIFRCSFVLLVGDCYGCPPDLESALVARKFDEDEEQEGTLPNKITFFVDWE